MSQPKLIDQLRSAIRIRNYSPRTEEAYWHWIKTFILFHNKRHPSEMGEPEVTAFFSHLAVERKVTASTQNQALSAVLFRVLGSGSGFRVLRSGFRVLDGGYGSEMRALRFKNHPGEPRTRNSKP